MTATLVLPAVLRPVAGGAGELPLEARTVRQALDQLAVSRPQLERRLRDEQGVVRPHVKLYLGGDDILDLSGLETELAPGARLYVIPAVSGG